MRSGVFLAGCVALALMGLSRPGQAQGVTVGADDGSEDAADEQAESLSSAAMGGQVAVVRRLLAAGANPNAKDGAGHSPLRMATSFGCMMSVPEPDLLATLDALIEAGANVNEVDSFGLGVLLMAAQKCKAAPIERLIKAGAKLDQRSPQGFSPLSMALIVKNYPAATALVEHGARLSRESMAKLFPEPPTEPELAALVKRATAAR